MHNFQYARMHKSLHMDALPARTSQLLALCTALAFAFFPCVFFYLYIYVAAAPLHSVLSSALSAYCGSH